jgi:quercetin dioxygenase-like cupin family protein
MAWYQEYEDMSARDGAEGRLVMVFTFREPSSTWEAHSTGEELDVCVAGSLVLHQELGDGVRSTTIKSGEAIVNPPGVWHTMDVEAPATALFITPSSGTEVRPR